MRCDLPVLLGLSVTLLGGCKKPEGADTVEDSRKLPDTVEPEGPKVDRDFTWFVQARFVARYRMGVDENRGITQWQDYATGFEKFVFTPGTNAVADFPLSDGRVVQLAIADLRREDGVERADCSVSTNWFFNGTGHLLLGCALFLGPNISLPYRERLHSNNADEHLFFEVIQRAAIAPDELEEFKRREVGKPYKPAREISAQEYQKQTWRAENAGHFTTLRSPLASPPEPFVRAEEK